MGRAASPGPRLSLRTEWSLLAFTRLLPLLVGAQLAATLTGRSVLGTVAFLALGGLAGGLSLLHLGRPLRSWRALTNLRSSWLSREILAFSLFVPLAAAAAWKGTGGIYLAASLAGLLLLFCVDRVYQRAEGRPPWPIRSAEALPAGLFLAGVLAGNPVLVWAMATLRLLLFLRRLRPRSIPAGIAAALRVAALLLPCLGPPPTWGLLLVVLAGEAIDRRAFYLGLDLPEPGALVDGAVLRAYPPAAGDPA
jgi:DMSO reductase anchor subunit